MGLGGRGISHFPLLTVSWGRGHSCDGEGSSREQKGVLYIPFVVLSEAVTRMGGCGSKMEAWTSWSLGDCGDQRHLATGDAELEHSKMSKWN